MSTGKVVKLLAGTVMFVGGGAIALAGMGYVGSSEESTGIAITGSIIAGFGIALGITALQNHRQRR